MLMFEDIEVMGVWGILQDMFENVLNGGEIVLQLKNVKMLLMKNVNNNSLQFIFFVLKFKKVFIFNKFLIILFICCKQKFGFLEKKRKKLFNILGICYNIFFK